MSVCCLIATIVIQCSAIGATCCYGVTSLVGRRIVVKYFPEKVKSWSEQVSALVLLFHDWGHLVVLLYVSYEDMYVSYSIAKDLVLFFSKSCPLPGRDEFNCGYSLFDLPAKLGFIKSLLFDLW